MIDEGYIKYQIFWEPAAWEWGGFEAMMEMRDRLFEMGLIGIYEAHGIGFGNVSMRKGKPGEFVVSGTQTGHHQNTGPEHYSLVTQYNIPENKVWCRGPVKASSEAMTHAAIYEQGEEIQAILHVHHLKFWSWLLNRVPTTAEKVPYGTPEMALEVGRLFREEKLGDIRIMAMAGHEEGLLTFGDSLEQAMEILMKWWQHWLEAGEA